MGLHALLSKNMAGRERTDISLLFLTGLAALGLVQLANPIAFGGPASVLPSTASQQDTLELVVLMIAYGAAMTGSRQIAVRDGGLHRLAWAIFALGSILAIVGIAFRARGEILIMGLRACAICRPFGPFVNYNHAATFLAASICIGAGLLNPPGRRYRRIGDSAEYWAKQAFVGFFILVQIAGLVYSGSRGGALALALTVAVFACLTLARRVAGILALGALGLPASVLAINYFTSPDRAGVFDGSAATRLSMWRSSFTLLADVPFTGIGLGGVLASFQPYRKEMVSGLVDHVHNDWLELGLESGSAVFVTLWVASSMYFVRLRRDISGVPEGGQRRLLIGFAAAAMVFAVHSAVEFSLRIPADALLLAIILGSLSAVLPRSSERASGAIVGARIMRLGAAGCLLLLGGGAVRAGWITWRAAGSWEERIPALSRAEEIDPSPRRSYRVAFARLQAASGDKRPENASMWRETLKKIEEPLSRDPMNSAYRAIAAAALSNLGRSVDSASVALP